jgi:1-deoxy-D-xylulose-5-phosphate synthase
MFTALNQKEMPFSIRYPKSSSIEFTENGQVELLPIGDWEIMQHGNDLAILAVGPMVYTALEAAAELEKKGVSCEVVNCRFIKPMDLKYLQKICKKFTRIITIEEGTVKGGFGSGVAQWLMSKEFNGKVSIMGLPDSFVKHGSREELLQSLGLDAPGIVNECERILK